MSCQKASYRIEKREVAKLTHWETLALKFHLLICSLCRKYESDSRILGRLLKKLHVEKKSAALTERDKKTIKEKLTLP